MARAEGMENAGVSDPIVEARVDWVAVAWREGLRRGRVGACGCYRVYFLWRFSGLCCATFGESGADCRFGRVLTVRGSRRHGSLPISESRAIGSSATPTLEPNLPSDARPRESLDPWIPPSHARSMRHYVALFHKTFPRLLGEPPNWRLLFHLPALQT